VFELDARERQAAEAALDALEARGVRANPYRAGRRLAIGRRGLAATAHPLASLAAVDALRDGGNAVDAAIAAAAVLAVVEPAMTGAGGDAFMLYYDAGRRQVYGLNGSGRSPAALSLEQFRARSPTDQGWEVVTVPGAVDAWTSAHGRFGRLALPRLLEPAIELAADGFAVTEIVAETWRDHAARLMGDAPARSVYLIDDRPPAAGQWFRNTRLAATLERIAADGRAGFYEGPVAAEIVRHARSTGGYFSLEDFAAHRSEWVAPIATDWGEWRIHQIPPNGQGLGVLLMLDLLAGFDLRAHPLDSAEYLHLLIEAKKLAYADLYRYVADPRSVSVPLAGLLDPDYAAARRRLIDPARAAGAVRPGRPTGSDTTCLATADGDGNAVSFINSLYFAFGSGIAGGDTGVLLQNRGAGFSLERGHPNCYAPSKRPYHTIIPGMVTRGDRPYLSYGLMGGTMQPQGHVQFLLAHLVHGLSIQEAIDLPRWNHVAGRQVLVEHGVPRRVMEGLRSRGHEIVPADHRSFGGAQAILLDTGTDAMFGASDPRKDGIALAI
jgi:gamma-glutamyltranspeptidase/glutathione hydrolase